MLIIIKLISKMIILDNKNTKIKYFINKNIKLFNPNINFQKKILK